jgi:hypothetical protein
MSVSDFVASKKEAEDMEHGTDVKRAAVEKLMRPGGPNVPRLSREMGISKTTLYEWLRFAKNGTMRKHKSARRPGGWNLRAKYEAVLKAGSLGEEEFGRWLREEGRHSEEIGVWRREIESALAVMDNRKPAAEELELRELRKELGRKDKALAELAALIVLKKKLQTILGDQEQQT